MAEKHGKRSERCLRVSVRHVSTSNEEQRLCRAFKIVLNALAKHTAQSAQQTNTRKDNPVSKSEKEASLYQVSSNDTPPGGDAGGDPYG